LHWHHCGDLLYCGCGVKVNFFFPKILKIEVEKMRVDPIGLAHIILILTLGFPMLLYLFCTIALYFVDVKK